MAEDEKTKIGVSDLLMLAPSLKSRADDNRRQRFEPEAKLALCNEKLVGK